MTGRMKDELDQSAPACSKVPSFASHPPTKSSPSYADPSTGGAHRHARRIRNSSASPWNFLDDRGETFHE